MQEFAPRRPGAPNWYLGGTLYPSLVDAAYQGGGDMTVIQVVLVVRTIKISRHDRDQIHAVLTPVGLRQLDPRDLGDRVPLIGLLQRTGQQAVLSDRLGGQARIDA